MKDVRSSLRSSFAWTFTGNALYAAAQWAILSLIAKLGGGEMLGQYALAVALTTPVVMLSHLNLRAVLATDVEGRYPFGDYLAVRLGVTALSLAAIAILALVFGGVGRLGVTILVTGLWQSLDTVSDIYYGAMQRRDEMSRIARSMMARGLASASVFGIVLWMARDLVWALAARRGGRATGWLGLAGRAGHPGDRAAAGAGAHAGLAEHQPAALRD
jgi:O-antigen/teichoic acid export membrane protein